MEIPDAYQEYVKARREAVPEAKVASLALPVEEMLAVLEVVASAVESTKLTDATKKRWDTIMDSMARSVRTAA